MEDISQLPPLLRAEAHKYAIKSRSNSTAINNSFPWYEAPQGRDFWRLVYDEGEGWEETIMRKEERLRQKEDTLQLTCIFRTY